MSIYHGIIGNRGLIEPLKPNQSTMKVAEMTEQIISEAEKKRIAKKEYDKQRYLANKEKRLFQVKKYGRSKEGLVNKIYGAQKSSSNRRSHVMPSYNLEELRTWMFAQPSFDSLYNNWVESNFDKMQVPSCDRLDDYSPYTLDNLQLTTWTENNARGHADRKAGINNKASKAVLQLTREGIVVAEHHSARHASRVTNINLGHLAACCRGKLKSAGGFVWCFVNVT